MLANGGWDLTLTLLTWTIWRTPTNASKWRMGFNSAFKGLILWQKKIVSLFLLEISYSVALCQVTRLYKNVFWDKISRSYVEKYYGGTVGDSHRSWHQLSWHTSVLFSCLPKPVYQSVKGLAADCSFGVLSPTEQERLSQTVLLCWQCKSPSLLSKDVQGFPPRDKTGFRKKMNAHLNIISRSRTQGCWHSLNHES